MSATKQGKAKEATIKREKSYIQHKLMTQKIPRNLQRYS